MFHHSLTDADWFSSHHVTVSATAQVSSSIKSDPYYRYKRVASITLHPHLLTASCLSEVALGFLLDVGRYQRPCENRTRSCKR
jgi:hypothetical protein